MKLLASFETPRAPATAPGRIVLFDLGEASHHPYVTWWENLESGGRIWGHYFKTREEGETDFAARVKRGY